MPGIQRFVRLEVQGVVYEINEDDNGEPVVRVYGDALGDEEFELHPEEVEDLRNFIDEFQELEQGNGGGRGRGRQSRSRYEEDEEDNGGRGGYQGQTVSYRGRGSSGGRDNNRGVARNIDGSRDKRVGPRDPNDTRGKVLDPEHDGRLRGNERYRPNDPDRERNREGGHRGGTSRGRGMNRGD